MMLRRILVLPVLAGLLAAAACDDDDPIAVLPLSFSADLSGGEEVPPVLTSATGTATFQVDGDEIAFTLTTSGLTGVTAAHIHGPAGTGENADVLVPLFDAGAEGAWTGSKSARFDAGDLTGEATTMAELVALMRAGDTYVNVHTQQNPAGAIRGQIAED